MITKTKQTGVEAVCQTRFARVVNAKIFATILKTIRLQSLVFFSSGLHARNATHVPRAREVRNVATNMTMHKLQM